MRCKEPVSYHFKAIVLYMMIGVTSKIVIHVVSSCSLETAAPLDQVFVIRDEMMFARSSKLHKDM